MTPSNHAPWHCLTLGDGLVAIVPLNNIGAAYNRLYPEGDAPLGAAVLSHHRLDSLHCQVTVYFSPALSGLAQQFAAQPCGPPTQLDLELLHGSWQGLLNRS